MHKPDNKEKADLSPPPPRPVSAIPHAMVQAPTIVLPWLGLHSGKGGGTPLGDDFLTSSPESQSRSSGSAPLSLCV